MLTQTTRLLKEAKTFQRLNSAGIFIAIIAATASKNTAPHPETTQLQVWNIHYVWSCFMLM